MTAVRLVALVLIALALGATATTLAIFTRPCGVSASNGLTWTWTPPSFLSSPTM